MGSSLVLTKGRFVDGLVVGLLVLGASVVGLVLDKGLEG